MGDVRVGRETCREGPISSSTPATGPPAVETGDAPPTPRIQAPGGWKRAAVGLLLGAVAGAIVGLVLPRDEGPRRTTTPDDRPPPFDG